ncbi:hypothetical protein [Gordonia sihwensis]|uniref:hypothetical protein n=1 Tax=Gordonia sihwensis TaxID=173559 RepID=UPI0005EF6CCA|nr:hypothetical protein [Gordonia sihwensis]KJR10543.1 hypothetical protein UG54_00680 [Gordonia sihwensis]
MKTDTTTSIFALTTPAVTPDVGEIATDEVTERFAAMLTTEAPADVDDTEVAALAYAFMVRPLARTIVLSASMNAADTDRAGETLARLAGRTRGLERALILAMAAIHFYCTRDDRDLFEQAVDEMNTALIDQPDSAALIDIVRQLDARPLNPNHVREAFTIRG